MRVKLWRKPGPVALAGLFLIKFTRRIRGFILHKSEKKGQKWIELQRRWHRIAKRYLVDRLIYPWQALKSVCLTLLYIYGFFNLKKYS